MNDNQKMELKSRIGTVFQGSALFDSMTIEENVMFPLKMFKNLPFDDMLVRVVNHRFHIKKVFEQVCELPVILLITNRTG